MKFLKIKYILTLSIILVIGAFLGVYFFGGIKAEELESKNLEFTYEGFTDYNGFDEDGNHYVAYESVEELQNAIAGLNPSSFEDLSTDTVHLVRYILNPKKIVAQNTKYTMYLDELTTVVSVLVNSTATETAEKTFEGFTVYNTSANSIIYESAIMSENNDESRSNILVKYVGSNSKVSGRALNTYANSVAYLDKLSDTRQRHYKIKFDDSNGIEILYEIGNFTVIEAFFPEKFDRVDLLNSFVGNLVFAVDTNKMVNNNEIVYTSAYTWSAECAAYVEEHDLGTVTPDFTGARETDEDGNLIPTRYNITDILETVEEDGNIVTTNVLKMKLGEHYNSKDFGEEGASPCIANPFANSDIYRQFFTSFYSLAQSIDDEEGNRVTYATDWRYNTPNLSPRFDLKATGGTQFTKLYEFMYKADTPTSPNFFYLEETTIRITEDNYEDYVINYPTINVGENLTIKKPLSYFERPDKVVRGYYRASEDAFYEDEARTIKITNLDDYDYFVDMYRRSLKTYQYVDGSFKEVNTSMSIGGNQARDEDGKFLFTDDDKPVQEIYTVEESNLQNEKFGINVEATPPIFQMGVRFELTEEGLQTTIINNSIMEGMGVNYREDGSRTKFSHDLKIYTVDVLPNFTTNESATSEGQIIVPDGSGAIISFNSPKAALGYNAVSKRIYGMDKAFTFERSQESDANKQMMFGMYGFLDKTKGKGVLAIADRGASQTSIYANFKRSASTKNVAYFTALFRENETVYVGGAKTPFLKWAKERSQTDFSYIYQFMNTNEFVDGDGKIQYVGLAKKYRSYLVNKYDLIQKDTTDYNVLALNFLGSFEKREILLGFGNNVTYSLTTFDQAKEIIEDLQNEGVYDFSVGYLSWTKDAMEPKATSKVKTAKVLGRNKGIRSFAEFLKENEINFYPEIRVATNKGYDYSYGNLKYTAKGVGSTYAHHREYDLATNQASATIAPITMLGPAYYKAYLQNYLNSFNKLGSFGGFLSDLGNQKVGDYTKSRLTYAELGSDYQKEALEYAVKNLDSVMLSAPYDYALQYADFVVDVPLDSSFLGYYDYSIPFYQLVVSGLFDYTGPAVNYDSEKSPNWYLLKALETGSNLQFLLSAEDTKILLNTDYTMFYNTFYANIKNDIVYMNNVINQIGIHNNSVLEGHKILRDNVYEVKYNNGVTLIINYNNTNYYDSSSGLSVRPNWFVVKEGA